jgi:hypothetical protein
MAKGLDAVDRDDRNIVFISLQEVGVSFNIDLLESVGVGTIRSLHRGFGYLAQMASWS